MGVYIDVGVIGQVGVADLRVAVLYVLTYLEPGPPAIALHDLGCSGAALV